MNVPELAAGHSPVGPSSLSRILLCPGSVRLSREIEDTTTEVAAEGTVAHEIGEALLKGKKPHKKSHIVQRDGHDIKVTQEMYDAVQVYVSHCKDLSAFMDDVQEGIEVFTNLEPFGIPDVYGTVDYSLYVPSIRTLYIRDYKHGKGVVVDPVNNPQLMAYALGVAGEKIDKYEIIDVGIVQPRAKEGNQIKTWQTTPEYLKQWAEFTLKPSVQLAMSDDGPLIPGDKQCQFCNAKSVCPELANKALKTAQADFSDFADIHPDEIVDEVSIEKIKQVYDKIGLLKEFIKAVEARVFSELSSGNDVPEYKLVHGKRSRSWKDEDEAVKILQSYKVDPYEYKILSPAKAEKQLGKAKKEVQSFIDVSEGKPVIVPEADKRQAIITSVNEFKEFAETSS